MGFFRCGSEPQQAPSIDAADAHEIEVSTGLGPGACPWSGAAPWAAGEAGQGPQGRESTDGPRSAPRRGATRRAAQASSRSSGQRPTADRGCKGSRQVTRPQPRAPPRRGDAVRGRIAPAPACGRARHGAGRRQPRPPGPRERSECACPQGLPERSEGPQWTGALAPEYRVGRPAREARYAPRKPGFILARRAIYRPKARTPEATAQG